MKICLTALFLISINFTIVAFAADQAAGRKVFQNTCATCHGPNGAGSPAGKSVGAPDLCSAKVQHDSDELWKQQVQNGKNNMPAFGALLSPEQIDSVVKYVRTFASKSPGQKPKPASQP